MIKLLAFFIFSSMTATANHRPELQSLIAEAASLLDIAILHVQDFIIRGKPFMAIE